MLFSGWFAALSSMRCPKCQFDHELQTTECLKCGIVFARYFAAQEAASKAPGAVESRPIESSPTGSNPIEPGRIGGASLGATGRPGRPHPGALETGCSHRARLHGIWPAL